MFNALLYTRRQRRRYKLMYLYCCIIYYACVSSRIITFYSVDCKKADVAATCLQFTHGKYFILTNKM